MSERRFKVALSFPGSKRKFVRKVAEELVGKLGKEKILYDDYLKSQLARPNLNLYLGDLYREHSDLVVAFVSADYQKRKWCMLEWRQMQAILFNMEDVRLMYFRFDNTQLPGLLPTDGYIEIGKQTPKEIANFILQRVEPHLANLSPAKKEPPKQKLWVWGTLALIVILPILLYCLLSPKPVLPLNHFLLT